MKLYTLKAEMWLPISVDNAFAFFSDAGNLDALTPPFLDFHIVTPRPIAMQTGTRIDYRLRVHKIPIAWQSEITVWQPPTQFVDEQRRGPYRHWHHRHDFAADAGGAWIRDHVEYRPRGWICAPLLNRWLVAPDLRAIFTYRHRRIRELLAPGSDAARDRIVLG